MWLTIRGLSLMLCRIFFPLGSSRTTIQLSVSPTFV